jgi:hypothetical protein
MSLITPSFSEIRLRSKRCESGIQKKEFCVIARCVLQTILAHITGNQRTFMDEIIAGTVLEMVSTTLSRGLTSIFTFVPAITGFTRKEISTSSSACISVTVLPPVVVVKMLVDSLVPRVRVTGTLPGVEKTISMPVRSRAGAFAGNPMENVIVSIPLKGSEDNP